MAAAGRELADGRQLRARDRLAIEVAIAQLEAEICVLKGEKIGHAPSRASFAGPLSPSIEFAAIVLDATLATWAEISQPADRVERLERTIQLLRESGAGDARAAELLAAIFDRAVDTLFFSSQLDSPPND